MRPIRLLLFACALGVTSALPAYAGPLAGFDVITSTVMQEGQSSFSGIGVRVRLTSARMVPGIDFLPFIEYWRARTTVPTFGIEASRRDATLGADARYTFRREGWSPYAGAGFGIHFLSTQVDAPSLGLNDREDALTKGAFDVLAGVSFPITTKIENMVEVKYHHVTDYRQLKLSWGLAFNF